MCRFSRGQVHLSRSSPEPTSRLWRPTEDGQESDRAHDGSGCEAHIALRDGHGAVAGGAANRLRVPHDPERGTALTGMTSERLYWFERFRALTS